MNHSELKAIVDRARVDDAYTYRADDLRREKIDFLAARCASVLDVGKSSRELFTTFARGQVVTMDVVAHDWHPDIIDDLCNPKNLQPNQFDGIVCLAILEHVYDPKAAVENMLKTLKTGGFCFVYVPFVYKYHAPPDGSYQDYYRYTRDGLAYLFRDFSEVTLYPLRGKYSSMFNLMDFWKHAIEGRFGMRANRLLDRVCGKLFGSRRVALQASGYFVWAVK